MIVSSSLEIFNLKVSRDISLSERNKPIAVDEGIEARHEMSDAVHSGMKIYRTIEATDPVHSICGRPRAYSKVPKSGRQYYDLLSLWAASSNWRTLGWKLIALVYDSAEMHLWSLIHVKEPSLAAETIKDTDQLPWSLRVHTETEPELDFSEQWLVPSDTFSEEDCHCVLVNRFAFQITLIVIKYQTGFIYEINQVSFQINFPCSHT